MGNDGLMDLTDVDACYRAAQAKDARFDGWFFIAVTTTTIYCRPSCPARTPLRHNIRVYPTAAAAQQAGFRACKRCRPDATPGSPEWNSRSDLVARAMRSIADGVIDREGVSGLAKRLGYSERHLTRLLTAEVGAGPLALARAQRAQTARTLIETTDMSATNIAFASGFASVRQFNDTVRDVFATTPTEMRRRSLHRKPEPGAARSAVVGSGVSRTSISLRLPYRPPFDGAGLLAFLGTRALPGVETCDGTTYRRTLRLPHGVGIVALTPPAPTDSATATEALHPHVACVLQLDDLRDLATAIQRCRRLFDLDADPLAVADVLGFDPLLGPLVRTNPGLRVPGHVDGTELAVRAVLGQQVSVAGARTLAGRIVAEVDDRVVGDAELTHLFPTAAAMAEMSPESFAMPRARGRSLVGLVGAIADEKIVIDPGVDRDELSAKLVELPGIGPWTASYIRMRAQGDPDVFLASDLGVRHALEKLGAAADPVAAAARAEAWRPWRSYSLMHLWQSLAMVPG
jgi:AraC family transcriptional regulator, regulatory protein of adaptative response / DNA-3-methyladenine glycosylase II